MSTLATDFAAAQEAALRADAALPAVMGLAQARIYSVVPTNAPLDYIVIGEDQILGDDTACAEGAEIFSTVHVWAKPDPPSSSLARAIGGVIKTILNRALTLAAYTIDDWELETETYSTDPDGSTHGVLVFHYWATEVAA